MRRGFAEYWPYALIALGGLLTLVASMFAAVHQTRFEREVRQRTEQTVKSITGGDSYCIVSPSHNATSPADDWSLWIRTEGDFPVYDVQVTIEDMTRRQALWDEERKAKGKITRIPIAETTIVRDIGNMAPATAKDPIDEFTLKGGTQIYDVRVMMRNGIVVQRFRFAKIDGQWLVAVKSSVRLSGQQEARVIEDNVPPGFPPALN
jgi:hypothetical protein